MAKQNADKKKEREEIFTEIFCLDVNEICTFTTENIGSFKSLFRNAIKESETKRRFSFKKTDNENEYKVWRVS